MEFIKRDIKYTISKTIIKKNEYDAVQHIPAINIHAFNYSTTNCHANTFDPTLAVGADLDRSYTIISEAFRTDSVSTCSNISEKIIILYFSTPSSRFQIILSPTYCDMREANNLHKFPNTLTYDTDGRVMEWLPDRNIKANYILKLTPVSEGNIIQRLNEIDIIYKKISARPVYVVFIDHEFAGHLVHWKGVISLCEDTVLGIITDI